MRAVVQRVKQAEVKVERRTVGVIGPGVLVFLGVGEADTEKDSAQLAKKIAHLRIFSVEKVGSFAWAIICTSSMSAVI